MAEEYDMESEAGEMTDLLTSQTTDGVANRSTPALTDDVEDDEDDAMRGSDEETSDANESWDSDDDYRRRGKGKKKQTTKKKNGDRDTDDESGKPKRTNEPWKREEDLILMRTVAESGFSKLSDIVEAYNAKLKGTGYSYRTQNAVVQRIPLIDAEFENALELAQTRGRWTDDRTWTEEENDLLKELLPHNQQERRNAGRKARKVLAAAYVVFTDEMANLGIAYHPRTKKELKAQVEVLENCSDAFDPPPTQARADGGSVASSALSMASPASATRTRRSRQDLPPLSRTKLRSKRQEEEATTEQDDSGDGSMELKSSDGKKRHIDAGDDDGVDGTPLKRRRTHSRAHALAVTLPVDDRATVVVDGVETRLLQQGLDAVNDTLRRMQENHSLHSERSIDKHYQGVQSSFADAQALAMYERGRHEQQLLHVIKTTMERMEVCTERKGVELEGAETARHHKREVEGPLTSRSLEARTVALAAVEKMTTIQLESAAALLNATTSKGQDHSTVPPLVKLAGIAERDLKELNRANAHVAAVEKLANLLQETLPRLTKALELSITHCAFLDNTMTMYVEILSAAMAAYVLHHTARQTRMATKAKEVAEEIADYECDTLTVGRREELHKHKADCQKCIRDSTDKMHEVVRLHRDQWDRSFALYPQAARGKVEMMYSSLSKALMGEWNKSIRAVTESIATGIRQLPKPARHEQEPQPAATISLYMRVVALFTS